MLFSYGSVAASSKRAIMEIGSHRAIVYAYLALVFLLIGGALITGSLPVFSVELLPLYLLQVAAGGFGAIAAYHALSFGKASVISPVSKSYVLLVILAGVFFLGESLSLFQVAGAVLIVISAIVISMGKGWKPAYEPWMPYLGLSIILRAYYYTNIKIFVNDMGAFASAVALETGITILVIMFHFLRGRDLSVPRMEQARFAVIAGSLIFFGSVFYNISVSFIGAALTAAVSAGTPIMSSVTSFFILGEKLEKRKYVAIVLTVFGLLLIALF
jgi:drug/metabolite transporter (DMT)-like permease